jgi:hypothetical protein
MVLMPMWGWHVISSETTHPINNNHVNITAFSSFTIIIVCKKANQHNFQSTQTKRSPTVGSYTVKLLK